MATFRIKYFLVNQYFAILALPNSMLIFIEIVQKVHSRIFESTSCGTAILKHRFV